jgi:hypothetical protein
VATDRRDRKDSGPKAAKKGGPKGHRPEFRGKPAEYCSDVLKVELTDAQEEVARLLVEPPHKVLVRAGHNVGTFSAATPAKNDPNDGETIQTTCGANASVEPTSPTDGGLWWEVQPQSGIIEPFAPGQEIKIPGGQSVQFECTSPGTPNILIEATFEE